LRLKTKSLFHEEVSFNLFLSYLSLFFLIVLVFACSRGEFLEEYEFKIIQEERIPTAVTTGGPKYSKEIFLYEKLLTLKPDPQKADSYLVFPDRFTMDDKGNFYVVDERDIAVKVFNSAGIYLRKFGWEGEGPGDFMAINLVGLEGDVITLVDILMERFTRYRTNGTFIDVMRAPPSIGSVPEALYKVQESKQLLIELLTEEKNSHRWLYQRATFLTLDFSAIKTIETEPAKSIIIVSLDTGGKSTAAIPFAPRPSIKYLKGSGVFSTSGKDGLVNQYNMDGELLRRIRIELDQQPITKDEKAGLFGRLNEQFEKAKNSQQKDYYKAVSENYEIPEWKGFSRGMEIDDAGFIWLEVPEIDPDVGRYRGLLFRILSPEGEYLGTSRWPGVKGTLVRGHLLAFVRDPDTDEMIANVFKIRPAVSGLAYQ
jgi:hypothetical protein